MADTFDLDRINVGGVIPDSIYLGSTRIDHAFLGGNEVFKDDRVFGFSTAESNLNAASGARGLFMNPTGTKLYMTTITNDVIKYCTLSTPWDLSTSPGSLTSTGALTSGKSLRGFWMSPDGTLVFVLNYTNAILLKHTLSTAWDMSSINTTATQTVSLSGFNSKTYDIAFSPDGKNLYMCAWETTVEKIGRYPLSTAWDLTTLGTLQLSPAYTSLQEAGGIYVPPDGQRLYVQGNDFTETIRQLSMSDWDISAGSWSSLSTPSTGVKYGLWASAQHKIGIFTNGSVVMQVDSFWH